MSDRRVGTELAGYRIERLLRRDERGVVYLAVHTRLERTVALRLVAEALAADARFRERFLRESKLVASLDHPNIIPVYEAGEADGILFLAMQCVEGTDLARLLDREVQLEPDRALAIVAQLAAALDTARWARGLVHGSLKPSEVLVVPAAEAAAGERILLGGFGFRHELPPGATLIEAAQGLGATGYLAPEQLEGGPSGPGSDVYALGCLLFACLTGGPAFTRDSPGALLQAQQPPSATRDRDGLSAAIDRVIRKSMAKRPEERYRTCEELAVAAQTALATSGPPSEQAPRDEHPTPVVLAPHPEQVLADGQLLAQSTSESAVVATNPSAPRRRKGVVSLASIGLVLLLAALVAGSIWLTRRQPGDVGSASPAASGEPDEADSGADWRTKKQFESILIDRRRALTVDGVPFSYKAPRGWQRFGSISINKSTVGSQGAEGIIFWTSFPDAGHADPCARLRSLSSDRSAAALATAVSTAPGTKLITGPSNVSVGGRAAKHVVLTVRADAGCDPGFFYTWQQAGVGAFWSRTSPGDTIRVWIVDVDGTRLFIEAETTEQAGSDLDQEILRIVESITFE